MKKTRKNSIIILVCVVLLSVFGCVMVYSASKYSATVQYNNQFFYLKKQILGVIIGIVGLLVCSFINHKIYKKFYWVFYIIIYPVRLILRLFGKAWRLTFVPLFSAVQRKRAASYSKKRVSHILTQSKKGFYI